jgi:cytochrome P450 family 307 subfamily A
MQKTRREMLKVHTFPRAFTTRFHLLDSLLKEEITVMTEKLSVEVTDFKPLLLQACANIFTSYFCSVKFSRDDSDFIALVKNFDKIFYEVNQGCAADFLPWLLPLHKNHLNNMAKWSHEIREFMVSRIISKRIESWKPGQEGKDYVDALIEHVNQEKTDMTMDTALFALEDIVGGHSAVANLVVKVLGFVAGRPDIQKCVQDEINAVCAQSAVTLSHRTHMPYTEAVILEAMRHISSPIVPHVANQQTTVQGKYLHNPYFFFTYTYPISQILVRMFKHFG